MAPHFIGNPNHRIAKLVILAAARPHISAALPWSSLWAPSRFRTAPGGWCGLWAFLCEGYSAIVFIIRCKYFYVYINHILSTGWYITHVLSTHHLHEPHMVFIWACGTSFSFATQSTMLFQVVLHAPSVCFTSHSPPLYFTLFQDSTSCLPHGVWALPIAFWVLILFHCLLVDIQLK